MITFVYKAGTAVHCATFPQLLYCLSPLFHSIHISFDLHWRLKDSFCSKPDLSSNSTITEKPFEFDICTVCYGVLYNWSQALLSITNPLNSLQYEVVNPLILKMLKMYEMKLQGFHIYKNFTGQLAPRTPLESHTFVPSLYPHLCTPFGFPSWSTLFPLP